MCKKYNQITSKFLNSFSNIFFYLRSARLNKIPFFLNGDRPIRHVRYALGIHFGITSRYSTHIAVTRPVTDYKRPEPWSIPRTRRGGDVAGGGERDDRMGTRRLGVMRLSSAAARTPFRSDSCNMIKSGTGGISFGREPNIMHFPSARRHGMIILHFSTVRKSLPPTDRTKRANKVRVG